MTGQPGSESTREFRVAHTHEGYVVAELTENDGLVTLIGGIQQWQAYAIVAVLDPPFKELTQREKKRQP